MTFKTIWDKLPTKPEIKLAIKNFSIEKYLIFLGLFLLLSISTIILLFKINNQFLITVPNKGGSLSEGIIGTPRFVNPILALSEADRDLTALVYSGLMRKTPEGDLIPDLAESYEVSDDGLTYIFILRD